MYTSYFNLNENPFSIAPDPLYLYMSEHHREALAHLKYGIMSDGGFVLLTGEVGAGKTTLCRSLLEQLPEEVVVAYVLNPKVSVIELLETVCDELHIERPEQGSIKQLVDRLNNYLLDANANGRKTVLIIDEAQNLSIDVLEQLRLLTNLETNRYKLLQIVLLGQPELLQILNRQEMRQLSQRVTARCHLGSLGREEIDAYIRHRLHIAGCEQPLFPASLIKNLWQLTAGIPRLINLICDRALLGAYVLERKQVDSKILRQAAREVLGDSQSPKKSKRLEFAMGLACFVLLLAATGLWSRQSSSLTSATTSPTVQSEEITTEKVATTAPRVMSEHIKPLNESEKTLAETAEPPNAKGPLQVNDDQIHGDQLPHTWPQGFAASRSIKSAFSDLAVLWGLSPTADIQEVCSNASDYGLGCLAREDSLETLRKLNRPALLTLYADDGTPFHVVMAQLKNDSALFIAGDSQQELALSSISSRWFGEYLLLWQRPPIKRPLLKPGEKSTSVTWLAQALQELGLYEATGREMRLDGSLLGAFKRFQFSQGLTPDGVLGPLSLIHLNNARNLDGPHLVPEGAS